ncbi:hypothetical protein BCR35DRAFT_283426, partial [Leucosporidium creatinivorum]
MQPLPAHQTKHLQQLEYPLPSGQFVNIVQNDSLEDSTGRTLWLGAQVLAVYLHDLFGSDKSYKSVAGGAKRRKTVCDLGSGTGLLALSLNAQGFDVLATDVPTIADGLLRQNLAARPPPTTELEQPILQARALDWFSESSTWEFSRWSISPPAEGNDTDSDPPPNDLLSPPFDFITTTDSIYDSSLSTPLLRTLSSLSSPPLSSRTPPPIFVALEVRDPQLIDSFLRQAKEEWGFKCSRVEDGRLRKLMGEDGVGWEDEDWEGVQVWKLVL